MSRILSGVLCILVVGCAGGPVLQVADPVWKLGPIVTGTQHERKVEVVNAGSAPLTIEKVEQCCGFNGVLTVPTSIPPGGRAEMILQVDAFKKIGDFNAEVTLVSNDPKRPRFPLMAVGQVVPKLYALAETANRSIDLGIIDQGTSVPVPLRIDNPGNAPLSVVGVETHGALRQSGSLPVIAPGGSGLLSFQFDASAPGPIDENVVISTSDALDRVLTVRFRGYVSAREVHRHALVIYPLGDRAEYDVTEKTYRYKFRVVNQGQVAVGLLPGEQTLTGLRIDLPATVLPGTSQEGAAILPLPKDGSGEGAFELRLILPFLPR